MWINIIIIIKIHITAVSYEFIFDIIKSTLTTRDITRVSYTHILEPNYTHVIMPRISDNRYYHANNMTNIIDLLSTFHTTNRNIVISRLSKICIFRITLIWFGLY